MNKSYVLLILLVFSVVFSGCLSHPKEVDKRYVLNNSELATQGVTFDNLPNATSEADFLLDEYPRITVVFKDASKELMYEVQFFVDEATAKQSLEDLQNVVGASATEIIEKNKFADGSVTVITSDGAIWSEFRYKDKLIIVSGLPKEQFSLEKIQRVGGLIIGKIQAIESEKQVP